MASPKAASCRGLPCLTEESPLLPDVNPGQAAAPPPQAPIGETLPLAAFLYQCAAFWATVKPVALTMLLTCLSVIHVSTEEQRKAARQGTGSYTVYGGDDDDEATTGDDDSGGGRSNSERLGEGAINAIVIIAFLCAVTFVVVLLYKYNCLKFLWGYMMLSVLVLLGQMGGVYFDTAIERYHLILDQPMFYLSLFNFSVVGVICIFYQKGTPPYIAQLYLVALAAIFAWNLSQFEDWTAWCLLIALALYDLCAVLTPCGPLRALVNLMEERGQPMPGLLYETNVDRPQRRPASNGTHVQPDQAPAPPRHQPRPPPGLPPQTEVAELEAEPEPDQLGGMEPPVSPSHSTLEEVTSSLHSRPDDAPRLSLEAAPPQPTAAAGEEESRRPNINLGSIFDDEPDEDEEDHESSVKLGIGDFVFYSVLVAKASEAGFATLAACFLVVLAGLGGTLLLLAIYQKALPALPLSILLGVIFFIGTSLAIIPYIETTSSVPVYS